MTKAQLIKILTDLPAADDTDIMFKDYGSDQGAFLDIGTIFFEENPDADYYNTILMYASL